MTQSVTMLAGLALLATGIALPAMAQTTTSGPTVTTTVPNMPVDNLRMTGGDRASKIIGSSVTNQANEKVGTVDDLIVTADDKVPLAILSVGGFLGIDAKYVAVPFSDLKVTKDGVMMPGATKDSLKTLPEFKYKG